MSHHFDTTRAREDARLNICDMYLFPGARADTTAMVLTTNPDAGVFAPSTPHPEAVYAFRFDVDGDAHEDVVFEVRPSGEGDRYQVLRIKAGHDGSGDLLLEGQVGEPAAAHGVQAFVGVAAELWAADAFGFFTLVNALHQEDRFATEAFENRNNLFKNRNVLATVLEVPNSMIGEGRVHAWATASLHGHAPQTQVYRWGLPLFTHLFLSDPATGELADRFHVSVPADDVADFGAAVAAFTTKLARHAGAVPDPGAYGQQVAYRLCPAMLPYEIGTPARFDPQVFNGRPMSVDAFDVMLTVGAGLAIADGVAPDADRIREQFPYCGLPYSGAQQQGLAPVRELIGLSY
ncbi:DUF4331 family protein [Streptosporangium subroseum]|uniref:DUF4331 family protein n=1 Tax=Streptosporangium subroseum TaxID=106412 RepID=UPI00308A8825|nr:DUF4331 domain-containing protein [Streptosporangium subroseum]